MVLPTGSPTGYETHGAEAQMNLLGDPPSQRANRSYRKNVARPLPNSVWHAPKASPVSNAGCARVSDAVEQRTGSHSQGVSSDRKSRQRRDIRIRRDGESRKETTNLVRIHLRIFPLYRYTRGFYLVASLMVLSVNVTATERRHKGAVTKHDL